MKLNNKGYMLVEIILASAIAFGLAFFIIDLTIKLKNKNDDLMVESLMNTDRTIVNNKLMSYIKEEENNFDCERLEIEGNVIKYKGNTIGVINEYATIGEKKCNVDDKNKIISINIKASVPQMPDKEYDINLNYNYHIGDINKITYKCEYNGTDYVINYTGKCIYEEENDGNWNIKFLTNGVLTILQNINIDAFLVGAGGSGISNAGGGGGYNNTLINYKISSGNKYQITIGQGAKNSNGGTTSAFGESANGGKKASSEHSFYPDGDWCGVNYYKYYGGAGGSGGGVSAKGGINGANGSAIADSESRGCIDYYYYYRGGTGSGKSTRAFGEANKELYSSGGGTNINGGENTGNGGYGNNQPGGSGIVVIRNSRAGIKINYSYSCKNMFNGSEPFAIAYTGVCDVIDEGNNNWKIKFLTSGTLTISENINIDTFLVGAGGSGEGYAGGGGGYVNMVRNYELSSGNNYSITIGQGAKDSNGGTTSAFGYTASGGKKASYNYVMYWENNGCTGGDGKFSGGAGGSGGGANGNGGIDGANGVSGPNRSFYDGCNNDRLYHYGGTGSGSTTREFGEAGGVLYSSGGGTNINGGDNTGNGSYTDNKPGGSGIVIIRNKR